jgi:NAD-dependent SIR2 family protein deacetylase
MTQENIKNAIKYATSNEQDLRNSDQAGCYYCKKIYLASDVTEFIEDERTALCPKCGIDSVLPSNSSIKLTPKNLAELNKYWF